MKNCKKIQTIKKISNEKSSKNIKSLQGGDSQFEETFKLACLV